MTFYVNLLNIKYSDQDDQDFKYGQAGLQTMLGWLTFQGWSELVERVEQ